MTRCVEGLLLTVSVFAAAVLAGCTRSVAGFAPGASVDASDDGTPPGAPNPTGPATPAQPTGGYGDDGGLAAVDCGMTGVPDLVTADTAFATAFLAPAVAQAGDGGTNVIVSPYSLSNALMMLDVGAAGETETQIEHVLSLPASATAEASAYAGLACALEGDGSSNGNSLDVVNSLWGQQGVSFEAPFLATFAQGYDAPLQTVDFAADPASAAMTINAWASQMTQGLIPSLLGPADVTMKTEVVLVNAVSFKGTWATGFDASMTTPHPFTFLDGSRAMVATMTGTVQASVASSSSLVVVELPYKGNAIVLDVLMPLGTSGTVQSFESTLTPATLGAALAQLGTPSWVVVDLPKFSFTTHVELAPVLEGMGMTDAFTQGVADLSAMAADAGLTVSAVVQQAVIEVDETGTVAAAGTGVVGCGDCLAVEEPPVIQIDHPFVVLIRDARNGAVLFMGQVVNPAG
jgi:serpin B